MIAPQSAVIEALEYARPHVPPPKLPPTPAALRRRKRVLLGIAGIALLVISFIAPIFVGNSARRVRIQHGGVQLPASTQNLNCGGNSLVLGGGVATATFSIDAAALPTFLAQFRIYTAAEEPLYFSPPFKPDGVFDGITPAGDDRVHVEWMTKGKTIEVELTTDTN